MAKNLADHHGNARIRTKFADDSRAPRNQARLLAVGRCRIGSG
uniref:Uncharacterized protein n=1 Tax=Arundo donax TaxID=35708 RepID=A0A0A8ZLB9_ARUDO